MCGGERAQVWCVSVVSGRWRSLTSVNDDGGVCMLHWDLRPSKGHSQITMPPSSTGSSSKAVPHSSTTHTLCVCLRLCRQAQAPRSTKCICPLFADENACGWIRLPSVPSAPPATACSFPRIPGNGARPAEPPAAAHTPSATPPDHHIDTTLSSHLHGAILPKELAQVLLGCTPAEVAHVDCRLRSMGRDRKHILVREKVGCQRTRAPTRLQIMLLGGHS